MWTLALLAVLAQEKPAPAAIEGVELAARQPHEGAIWYDNFDAHDPKAWRYMEPGPEQAGLTTREALGGKGGSMECFYRKGQQGSGNRKLVFGDSPVGRPLRREEKFDDVYWRIYVKHPRGWVGAGPDKMSRATIFAGSNWSQAAILHVWGGGPNLTLDPATGVRGDQLVTTRYNDFANLKWLGNSPGGKFPIHAAGGLGRWVCVEARMKLNTPGQKDGAAALWVDGRLDAERHGMNFRGGYSARTINAVLLEAYWNNGSPVDQARWYDDFVVSPKPIGPLTAPATPTLFKAADPGCAAWEAEVASDGEGKDVAWRSPTQSGPSVRIEPALKPGPTYFCRARQRGASGEWSDWSGWHQPFKVTGD